MTAVIRESGLRLNQGVIDGDIVNRELGLWIGLEWRNRNILRS